MKQPQYFQGQQLDLANLLAFTNHGGFLNQGVCWWHSLFQRNATYLTVYKPQEVRPDRNRAQRIIWQIIYKSGVVEIPGFKNLSEFSTEFSREIQNALETWQQFDGLVLFGWIRGISGRTEVRPEILKQSMDELYHRVTKNNEISFQKLQIPGIPSHAWLVVKMVKTATGYDLLVIDSNYRGPRRVQYQYGMKKLTAYRSVPYTSRNSSSYQKYFKAQRLYCEAGLTADDLQLNDLVD